MPPFGLTGPLRRSSPLRRGPQGPGAQSGRNAVRALTTISALQGVRKLTNVQRLRLAPLAPFAPRGGRGGFALLPASRGRVARKTMMGDPHTPLGDARVVRRPGIDQASVIIRSNAAISGKPPQPIMPPAN